ncbi:MAG: hypothetical protein KTR16_17055 [Acidiferrobacterales bacterium]|nr:hypothetical protein [Acidiferrobacterales bacterium]
MSRQTFYKYVVILLGLSFCSAILAHHSFAAFDTQTKIERTGLITRYDFVQPHIRMEIGVNGEDVTTETWKIESLVPRRWERLGLARDFVKQGETATLIGFPARNGSNDMMFSAIRKENGQELVARDWIQQ